MLNIEEKTIYLIPELKIACGKINDQWVGLKDSNGISNLTETVANAFTFYELTGKFIDDTALSLPSKEKNIEWALRRGWKKPKIYPVVTLTRKEARELLDPKMLL